MLEFFISLSRSMNIGFWGCIFLALFAACSRDDASYKNIEASQNTRYIDLTHDVRKVKVTPDDMEPFFVKMRTPHITQFECSTCHSGDRVADPDIRRNRHGDIEMQHAAPNIMTCQTCHHNTNFDVLVSLSGAAIEFDRAFELCGQCHFQKLEDWRHGAHGKRLHNWQGVRVVNNCTECHNPHGPRIPKRMPAAFPILKPERSF